MGRIRTDGVWMGGGWSEEITTMICWLFKNAEAALKVR